MEASVDELVCSIMALLLSKSPLAKLDKECAKLERASFPTETPKYDDLVLHNPNAIIIVQGLSPKHPRLQANKPFYDLVP